jgi:hypothetical protein
MIQTKKSPVSAATDRGSKSNQIQPQHYITRPQKMAPPGAKWIGGSHCLLVFFGGHDCWDLAKRNNSMGRDSVALFVGDEPESKSWKCAEGRSVVCIELDDTGAGFRMALVRTLAAYFAYEVALIPSDCNPCNAVFWGCV